MGDAPRDVPEADALAATRVGLDELLSQSDAVTLHCPLTPETRHVIDAAALARMKPTAVLVNTARGACVDEEALADALERGVIAGAGLDVFVNEPAIRAEFLALPNVLLMPHQGSATVETRRAMGELVLTNLAAYFAGETPPTSVIRLPGEGAR